MYKFSYYVLSISFDNYLLKNGGVAKYIEEQQNMLNSLDIGYVLIAPIRKFALWNKNFVLHDLYAIVINGYYQGIYTERQLVELLQTKQETGENLIGVFIHHCLKLNLDFLDYLLRLVPEVPVFFYIHDYYSVCSNYNLLRNDKFFCGKEKRSEKKCRGCSYYSLGMEQNDLMKKFLSKNYNRIIPVSPSDFAKDVWINSYNQYRDKIKVVPHLVCNDYYTENMHFSTEKIRIAYVGSAMPHKGWNVWKNLYEIFDKNQSEYELYTFGHNTPKCVNTTRVEVSITMDEKDKMQTQLRKFGIDCVILWSNWPETYSYTYFESYAANTFILTCEDSGNIAHMINKVGNGLILKNEEQLKELLEKPKKLRSIINDYYNSAVYGPLKFEKNCEIENMLEKKDYKFLALNKMKKKLYNGWLKCLIAGILYQIKNRGKI